MDSRQVKAQLRTKLNKAIASGLNAAATKQVEDIVEHVAVDTGNLRDSYKVTHEATTDDFHTSVSSDVSYRAYQYPYNASRSKPTGTPPLFEGDRMEQVARKEVEDKISQEFR